MLLYFSRLAQAACCLECMSHDLATSFVVSQHCSLSQGNAGADPQKA